MAKKQKTPAALRRKTTAPICKKNLNKLLKYAGSNIQLCEMLREDPGYFVTPQKVHNWRVRGRISQPGAVAVLRNKILREHFSYKELRPDVDENRWPDIESRYDFTNGRDLAKWK